MFRQIHAVLVYAVSTFALGSETEWPQFRGPTGQGVSSATHLPITWSASEHVAWKIEIPGHGWSSPVLSGGRLYLTSAVADAGSSDITLHAYCFEAATGKQIWDTEIFRPTPASSAAMHQKNSAASPTPIVAEGRLYVHFGHMGTAALDLAGQVLWRQTGLPYLADPRQRRFADFSERCPHLQC